MPERHHWQCSFNADQNPRECDCGLTGPRAWSMDHLPHDRAPTEAEVEAWRGAVVVHEDELGAAHEPDQPDA
jgi:hypothetical protein